MIMNDILSDESVIIFQDGNVIKGADNIGGLIEYCCEIYSKAYMRELGKVTLLGVIVIGVGYGVGYGVKRLRKKLKNKKELSGGET